MILGLFGIPALREAIVVALSSDSLSSSWGRLQDRKVVTAVATN